MGVYLVKPHLNEEDFQEVQKIVDDFGSGVGQDLHRKLQDHAKYKRNDIIADSDM